MSLALVDERLKSVQLAESRRGRLPDLDLAASGADNTGPILFDFCFPFLLFVTSDSESVLEWESLLLVDTGTAP